MLILHIAFSVLGIMCAFFYHVRTYQRPTLRLKYGYISMCLALGGVTISGIFLFTYNTELFLTSSRFLSNMTILSVLIVSEILYAKHTNLKLKHSLQGIVLFSWLWIFIAAILDLSYSYTSILLVYTISAVTIATALYQRKTKVVSAHPNN